MSKVNFMTRVSGTFNQMTFQLKKHSPEILLVAGVIGTVTSAVMACKATTKVSIILEETKESVEQIHAVAEDETKADVYSAEDAKKDLAIVYVQTGLKFAKLYAPSVILGALSIMGILTSNNILRKRNLALATAYATVDKGFKEYRSKVVERYGNQVDKELRYGVKAKEIEKTVEDENGKKKTIKETINVTDGSLPNEYARYFEQYTKDDSGNIVRNPNWEENSDYNLFFLSGVQNYANDKLTVNKILFLNEVYEMLGLPKTKAGQMVGWIYDPTNPETDSYVDFGIDEDNIMYNENGDILLDFNPDGNIWKLM